MKGGKSVDVLTLSEILEVDRTKRAKSVKKYCEYLNITMPTYYSLRKRKPSSKTYSKLIRGTGLNGDLLMQAPIKKDEI